MPCTNVSALAAFQSCIDSSEAISLHNVIIVIVAIPISEQRMREKVIAHHLVQSR
jgi:hypothetical protein